jgi:hypothetical protein
LSKRKLFRSDPYYSWDLSLHEDVIYSLRGRYTILSFFSNLFTSEATLTQHDRHFSITITNQLL